VTDATGDAEPVALFERRGAVGVITLNRPRAMNAVNAALSTAVGEAVEELAADPELRVGVVTGSGRAFCAGMDLKEFAAGRPVSAPGHEDWGFAGITRHYIDKPLIAAVNGFALGGGTEILLACDLAVMSEDAVLGLPEVSRGLFAAAGGIVRLPRMVPRRVAMEAILTGDPVDAARALELGLVNRVVPADQVLSAAIGLAERIGRNAPLAVQASKRLAYRGLRVGDDWSDELWELNDGEFAAIAATEDALDGARAFTEKRAPRWQAR
jgi:crotonobetainyl-CoA hydratase